MKICSLLPSATEILFGLGLGDQISGVSHECDFPPEAGGKPVLIHSRISPTPSAAAIDREVRGFLDRGESIYTVDIPALAAIEPDLIITQDLCHVCAATPHDLAAALAHLPHRPDILTLNPHSLADICSDIRRIGEATASSTKAAQLIRGFEERVANVARSVAWTLPKRVVCLEWLDPLYVAGHWVPEMVARAGGVDMLGRAGQRSFRVQWNDVIQAQPDIIVIMPCGYTLERAMQEFAKLPLPPNWREIPAARNGCIFAVEASGYFSRPGPRIADGVDILAEAIHFTDRTNSEVGERTAVLARAAAAAK